MATHVKCNGKVFCEANTTEQPFVILELSYEAAKALKYVVGRVHGDVYGARQYVDAVYHALEGVDASDYSQVISGQITFVEQPKANKDGWIEWHGGTCPVNVDVKVDAQSRSGIIERDCAGSFWWKHSDVSGDIIAYRVVK